MQFISNKLYLALNAALFIAYNGDEDSPIPGSEIVDYCGLHKRALEPVLQRLSAAGLIVSIKGSKGGYFMLEPEKHTLKDVAEIFIETILPEKHNFTGYDDTLNSAIKSAYKIWLDQMSKTTFQTLREQRLKPPVLNYTI